MTTLLQALQAAAEAGFDAPKCDRCEGRGRYHCCPEHLCDWCDATGFDASDPERLIGRAFLWLTTRHGRPELKAKSDAIDYRQTEANGTRSLYGGCPVSDEPADVAAILLRIVARVGVG